MGPSIFCGVFAFLGIIVTYTSCIDGLNAYENQRIEYKSRIHRTHHRLSHDKLKTISENVLRTFDTSCLHIPLPTIENGSVAKVHRRRVHMRNMKTKDYLIAEFKCQKGYILANKQHGKMFCSRSKWIGKKPTCDKSTRVFTDILRNDVRKSVMHSPHVQKCLPGHKKLCKHFCYILNGEAKCGCPLGFKEVGNDCQDINECEDPKVKFLCPFGCLNSIGSYHCNNSYEDYILADEPSRESNVKENDEYEDYEEEDYDENYDEFGELKSTKPDSKSDSNSKNEVTKNEMIKEREDTKTESVQNITVNSVPTERRKQVPESDENRRNIDTKESDSYDDEDYEESDYEDEYDDDEKPDIDRASTTIQNMPITTTQSSSIISADKPSKGMNDNATKDMDNSIDSDSISENSNQLDTIGIDEVATSVPALVESNSSDKFKTFGRKIDPKEHTNVTDFQEEEDEDYDDDYEEENSEQTSLASNENNILLNANESIKNETEEPPFRTEVENSTQIEIGNENNGGTEEYITSTPSETVNISETNLPELEESNSDNFEVRNRNDEEKIEHTTQISEKGIDRSKESQDRLNKIDNTSETDEEYDDDDYEDYDQTTTVAPIRNEVSPSASVTTTERVMSSTEIIRSTVADTKRTIYISGNSKEDANAHDNLDTNGKETVDSQISQTTENINNEADEDDYGDEYDEEITTTVKSSEEPHTIITSTTSSTSSTNELDNQIVPTKEGSGRPDVSTARSSDDKESSRRNKPTDNHYEYDDNDDEYEEYEDSKTEESGVVTTEIKKCQDGYKLDEKMDCADIDECNPDTNPCSDQCENTPGSYICSCPTGFRLSPADSHICQDIDECQDNPCSHTCINSEGSYKCGCPKGLTLENTTCINLTCSHGETKINGKIQCTCPSGYVLGFDNRTCEDVNECLLVNDCAHICHNTDGSYECSCRPGFVLEKDKLCIDIDECQGNHGCQHNCENSPGTYKCSCREGYDYVNTTNSCVDIDECDESRDLDECDQICINYEGGYECGCRSGFKLGSDDATCEDIKECEINNGNCSQICEDSPGSFACKCIKNYSLNEDNRTCRIIDPCLVDNGGCSHHCSIINESVRCSCPENYELAINEQTCTKINPCTIENGGCSHLCEFVDDQVNCLCPELYTLQNKTQCVEVNPCWDNNGGCSHICHFEDHKQSCLCPSTHELRNRTHCLQKNPCLLNNGGCSDICNFSNGVLSCSCPENYYLEGKICYRNDPCLVGNGGCSHECFSDEDGNVKCLCPLNFVLQNDQKICIPQDLCLVNNGNCSHVCDSSTNQVTCSCPKGYHLLNGTLCVQSNPCLVDNGGCSDICENIFGEASCACPDNYALEDEHNCVIVDKCLEDNGGCSHFCKRVDNQVQCSCPDRYNLVNQTECLPLNPCNINNGGCSHECSVIDNKVSCSCPMGYKLESKTCILINPCDHKNGGCSHVCRSINGLVACECPPEFELINKACFKKNPCSINNGGCSHGCTNVRGQAKCSCPPGYKLFGKICLDNDPCEKNKGGCSHFCHSKNGKRECSCPAGYILRPNRRVCKEVNECKADRGGCSHGCKNLPGSYQCTCPLGLKLDHGNKTCIDIDECRIDNGKCEMICRNFKGGHKCDCPSGYTLQRDKRSCRRAVTIQCRVPLPPKHGIMRCSDQIMEQGTLVPSGTTCNFWCNEGYKLKGRSPRLCSSSGQWESDEPRCIVATCPKLPPIKNGWYLPGVCNSGRTYPGESCEIYCRKGFKPRSDIGKYVCDANMQWMPNVKLENLQDACISGLPNIHLKCPRNGHIEFILPEGQRHMMVKIPRPESSVDWTYVTSEPSWGTRLETTLPAGRTQLRFTAVSPTDFNTTASCHLVINVLDKEVPKVLECPTNIERNLPRGQNMLVIHWREPQFKDNVGVATVYKSREPGGEFGLGIHHITYVGSDEAGNRAFCHFSINIRDDLEMEESNSIQYSSTFTNHNSAGKYRAVLICPSGVQYMSNPPDSYNNMLTSEAGCYWRHVKVTRPMQPQNYKVTKVFTESKLPSKSNRRVFFKWNR